MSDDFDAKLHAALQRRDPPPGFAERVLARAGAANHGMAEQAPPRRALRVVWAWAAIAAMLVAAVGYRQVQQQRAERAHEQALTALRITAEKLNAVRAKVLERERSDKEKL